MLDDRSSEVHHLNKYRWRYEDQQETSTSEQAMGRQVSEMQGPTRILFVAILQSQSAGFETYHFGTLVGGGMKGMEQSFGWVDSRRLVRGDDLFGGADDWLASVGAGYTRSAFADTRRNRQLSPCDSRRYRK